MSENEQPTCDVTDLLSMIENHARTARSAMSEARVLAIQIGEASPLATVGPTQNGNVQHGPSERERLIMARQQIEQAAQHSHGRLMMAMNLYVGWANGNIGRQRQ